MPAVQTVSRKRKLDPDDFLLEGKDVVKSGLQTANLYTLTGLLFSLQSLTKCEICKFKSDNCETFYVFITEHLMLYQLFYAFYYSMLL